MAGISKNRISIPNNAVYDWVSDPGTYMNISNINVATIGPKLPADFVKKSKN